jgi:hypothetical protein
MTAAEGARGAGTIDARYDAISLALHAERPA